MGMHLLQLLSIKTEKTNHRQLLTCIFISGYDSMIKSQLTLFHHADVNAAFETTGLTVTPVVLSDGATPVEWTGEGRFALHAASIRLNCQLVHYPLLEQFVHCLVHIFYWGGRRR